MTLPQRLTSLPIMWKASVPMSPEFAEVMRILQQCADKTPNKSIMKVVLHAENTRLFGVKRALLAAAIGIIAGLVLVRTWKST
eukprot:m.241429 g.241429  ORF g.241429 m.241429 type:complete len:83 (+) comp15323_c0_seq7:212-460(+)